jgi:hypothetical protein
MLAGSGDPRPVSLQTVDDETVIDKQFSGESAVLAPDVDNQSTPYSRSPDNISAAFGSDRHR